MSISFLALALYCGALFLLFITPGPVWIAVIARTASGGFRAAFPLALGVAMGDILWSLFAIFGINRLIYLNENLYLWLGYGAALFLIIMGANLIRAADKQLGGAAHLSKPGAFIGFLAGLFAVIANPKASLFYLALLPGFFSLGTITWLDVLLISTASFIVPLAGNIVLMGCVEYIRSFLASKSAVRRTNIASGWALIAVGIAIALSYS